MVARRAPGASNRHFLSRNRGSCERQAGIAADLSGWSVSCDATANGVHVAPCTPLPDVCCPGRICLFVTTLEVRSRIG